MSVRYRDLLSEVVASYTPEKRAEERRRDVLAFLVFRPLSFLVSPLFLLAGFSADGVTALGFAIAFAMPGLAWVLGAGAAAWVSGLVFANLVLDCVDGNLARVTRRSSRVGGMLDGAASMLFWAGWFVAVGGLAQGADGGFLARHGREIGLVVAVLFLAQRSLEDGLDECTGERVRWEPPVPGGAPEGFSLVSLGRPLEQGVAMGGPVLAASLGRLPWLMAGVAAYQLGLLVLWVVRYVAAVRRYSIESRREGG